MLKKTISYEDFNGKQVEQTCYFHLSKSELVELEMSRPGGLQAWLQRIIEAEDGKSLMEEFKNLILKAYGKRTEDGSGFRKSQALREEFEASQAYDTLFMEVATDADAAAAFVNGIVPNNMQTELAKLTKTEATEAIDQARGMSPSDRNVFERNESEVITLTPAQLREMDAKQLQEGLASGLYKLP